MTDWPNWSGETAVIVATGPSAAKVNVSLARGVARVFVVKGSWRLAPWADCLYGLDRSWWMVHKGVPKFKGRKFSPSPMVCEAYPDITQVRLLNRAEIVTGEVGVIGCGLRTGGGHSGFQALNLAVQFGAKRAVLVGFDMTLVNGDHWNSDLGTGKADRGRTESWRAALDGCAKQIRGLGVEVLNASPESALKAYPKVDLRDALCR